MIFSKYCISVIWTWLIYRLCFSKGEGKKWKSKGGTTVIITNCASWQIYEVFSHGSTPFFKRLCQLIYDLFIFPVELSIAISLPTKAQNHLSQHNQHVQFIKCVRDMKYLYSSHIHSIMMSKYGLHNSSWYWNNVAGRAFISMMR